MKYGLTEEHLRSLTLKELVKLFQSLEAPSIEEMNGEYTAYLLAQPNFLATTVGNFVLNNPLRQWLSKAFRPIDENNGRGYNTFLQGGRVIQCYPMSTLIAPSRFDHKPAYQLIYRQFYSTCGSINMVDEVRKVSSGLYIGIGTYGFTTGQRQIPYPFLLKGPHSSYRGDIGRERSNFKISHREIPNLNLQS